MTRLNNIQVDDLYQAWYPDSSQIAFTSTRGDNYELPDVILYNDPWFGAPWCMRDSDGDMQPDTPTIKFKTDDFFAYIMFPFRNMKDGVEWSHIWIPENGFSMNNLGWWDSGGG